MLVFLWHTSLPSCTNSTAPRNGRVHQIKLLLNHLFQKYIWKLPFIILVLISRKTWVEICVGRNKYGKSFLLFFFSFFLFIFFFPPKYPYHYGLVGKEKPKVQVTIRDDCSLTDHSFETKMMVMYNLNIISVSL